MQDVRHPTSRPLKTDGIAVIQRARDAALQMQLLGSPETFRLRGQIYRELKEYDKAIDDFTGIQL